jgi:hypothetical protein
LAEEKVQLLVEEASDIAKFTFSVRAQHSWNQQRIRNDSHLLFQSGH